MLGLPNLPSDKMYTLLHHHPLEEHHIPTAIIGILKQSKQMWCHSYDNVGTYIITEWMGGL